MSDDALRRLDPALSSPKRLVAMALLRRATSADFRFLRDRLEVSDSDLSKQMAALEAVGYVDVVKVGRGRGGSTTYRITADGRAAYDRHRAALVAILADGDEPADQLS